MNSSICNDDGKATEAALCSFDRAPLVITLPNVSFKKNSTSVEFAL